MPIYNLLNEQFKLGKSLVQQEHQHLIPEMNWPSYCRDIWPVGKNYYHELNPYFTFNVTRDVYFKFSKTFTVRDGLISFGAFILKYADKIPSLGTHFLIHPALAPYVPFNLRSFFSVWEIWQAKDIKIQEAKAIDIYGNINQESIEPLEELEKSLQCLKVISRETVVNLCLPIRRNPLDSSSIERTTVHEVLSLIKDTLPKQPLRFINTADFVTSNFRDHYLINLNTDNYIVSDNYIDYLVASSGGVVSSMKKSAPKNSIYEVVLSPYHSISIQPFPDVECLYDDILEYSNYTTTQSPETDPQFHSLFRTNS